MLPRSRRTQPDQFVIQSSSHRLDPATHVLQIALPFLPQLLGAKDLLDDVGSTTRRHAVLTASQEVEIRENGLRNLLRASVGHHMQHTGSLTIESKVLGKGLRDAEFELGASVQEMLDSPSVLLETAGCEALIGEVEERNQALGLADDGEFHPLLFGRVSSSRVVGASVEDHYVALFRLGFQQEGRSFVVETLSVEVVVRVGFYVDLRKLPDGMVIAPSGLGDPDAARFEGTREKLSAQSIRASARDGLNRDSAVLVFVLLSRVRFLESKHQIASQGKELQVTLDGQILVAGIVSSLVQLSFDLFDDIQGPRTSVFSAIDTNSQVDLVGVRISEVFAMQCKWFVLGVDGEGGKARLSRHNSLDRRVKLLRDRGLLNLRWSHDACLGVGRRVGREYEGSCQVECLEG